MLSSGGSPNFDRVLGEFTPEEFEGFKGFMRWISDHGEWLAKQPRLAHERMVDAFHAFVPTKGEADLVRLFEALDQDITEVVGSREPRPPFITLFFYGKHKARLRKR